MNLTATIGGTSRAPLIAGSTITLRRPVSSASLLIDDPNGDIDIDTLDEVVIGSSTGLGIAEVSALAGHALIPFMPGGETPEALGSGSTVFRGYVNAITIDPKGMASKGSRILRLECVDLNWRLDNPPGYLTKSYTGVSDQDIILDALSVLGLAEITADTSTVAEIETGLTVAFDGATMRDVLEEMVKISGGVWWVEDSTLYYNAEADSEAAAWDINTDAPDADAATFDVQRMSVASRHDFPLNSVTVVGPTGEDGRRATATASDATSIATYGTFAKKFEIKSLTVDSYAQLAADQLVAAGKDPRETIRFEFDDSEYSLSLTVNQKLTATCARLGLSAQDFVTREVRITQEVGSISRFSVEAGDARPAVQDILKRLNAASKSGSTNLPQSILGLDFTRSSSQAVNSGTSIASIDDLTDFTVLFTIRPDQLGITQTIVAKDDGSNLGWVLQVDSFNNLEIERTRASVNYGFGGSSGFAVGGVYKCVARVTTTGLRLWVNGFELTVGGGAGSGAFDTEASSPLRVARKNSGSYFDGMISRVALWNIALPETTTVNLHNANFASLPFATNLKLAWALDEFADGSTASGADAIRDRSTSGYNGTPASGPVGDISIFISE